MRSLGQAGARFAESERSAWSDLAWLAQVEDELVGQVVGGVLYRSALVLKPLSCWRLSKIFEVDVTDSAVLAFCSFF